jgi:hypothetical protein
MDTHSRQLRYGAIENRKGHKAKYGFAFVFMNVLCVERC